MIADKEALQANISWAKSLGTGSKVIVTTYEIIAHKISIISIKMNDQRGTIAQIQVKSHRIEDD